MQPAYGMVIGRSEIGLMTGTASRERAVPA
jgi:hypothetical protein